ncbi:auxin-repressed 12.5 kDa protein-like [Corylus avellana]|uniref:auxin-repressed 12.5 kDa protein-like n=1 Tax=Corylus avellana TaxID=13451 RepID=UPI00286C3A35|nr:auxin-repressed 12.5 kDa protein-like [Corylus avellana]
MVLLEKLWDDVVAGPQPERGLGKLRKITAKPLNVQVLDAEGEGSKFLRSTSMPASPATPSTPITPTTPGSVPRKDNVWRSVFNPGSNLATKTLGAHQMFDKPEPNSPTVYDWLYSGETRSKHHR